MRVQKSEAATYGPHFRISSFLFLLNQADANTGHAHLKIIKKSQLACQSNQPTTHYTSTPLKFFNTFPQRLPAYQASPQAKARSVRLRSWLSQSLSNIPITEHPIAPGLRLLADQLGDVPKLRHLALLVHLEELTLPLWRLDVGLVRVRVRTEDPA